MEFLVIIAFIVFVSLLNSITTPTTNNKNTITQTDIKKVMQERWCPPHKWKYEEVKSSSGEIASTRIVCELCGPLKPLNQPERMDY